MSERRAPFVLLLGLALCLGAPALGQDELDFKKLIEKGEYAKVAQKLKKYLNVEKADPKLRKYLEMNIAFLERGAEAKTPGSELILVRGARNDQVYKMPAASGGDALMLPNSIRYMRKRWDDRLPRIDKYFVEATTSMGGDGNARRELDKILTHHKGGGLGTNANSTKSVLISASTKPLATFGPPFYILKVAPERAIFNTKGLQGEAEVLLPFWVLPKEIVAKCNTMEEVKNHPLFQQSKLKDLQVSTYGYGAGGSQNNWEIIEQNIRNGRPPLDGVAGLNSYFPGQGTAVGPVADRAFLDKFVAKVKKHGGEVELVGAGDKRLPENAQARTYLDAEGKPRVLLRRGQPVRKVALLDELTHVLQLKQMVKARGSKAVEEILLRARLGDPVAKDVVNRWEIRAKKLVRGLMKPNDPARKAIDTSIKALEAELDPYARLRRPSTKTIDWKAAGKQFGKGLGHFTLALFLKELALVAKTGDTLLIEEFFQGLLTTDFYVHYGLFSIGAAAADTAYATYVERHVAKFVKPRFVQSVLRSNISLAAGMALPDLIMGRFQGKAFAISLAGLGLSSAAVKAGVAGIKWVANLSKVKGGASIAARVAKYRRLTKVGGFLYAAVETAVVLYFGDKIARAIDEKLEKNKARDAIRAAAEKLLADPKGPNARADAEALAEAFREQRDLLARPLMEAEAILWARLGKTAKSIKGYEDAMQRYRELAKQDPDRYGRLASSATRIAARARTKHAQDVEKAIAAFEKTFAARAKQVYGTRGGAPSFVASLRGWNSARRRTDWTGRMDAWHRGRRLLNAIADAPDTRLAAYDHEAALYDAIAKSLADDPAAAAEYERLARLTRETRDADGALVLGDGKRARPKDAEVDATAKGFLDALEKLGD